MIEIIAEIGRNHNGDMATAKKMIDAAKENGAHYAKFQTWSVTRLKQGEWDDDGRREIYNNAELTEEDHKELIDYCNQAGIEFLSSAFSIPDAELLRDLGIRAVKIPSFESRNHELISYCNENFDIVIMSTGTSTLEEIKESCKLYDKANLYLLHCVSTYPGKYEEANMPRMQYLNEQVGSVTSQLKKIGYSDHIEGVESAKIAIGLGATVVEKHFTIDKELPGRDNRFAILPEMLDDLSTFCKRFEAMNIDHGQDYQEVEQNSRENYAGRFNKK